MPFEKVAGIDGLWLDPFWGLTEEEVYHYWLELDDSISPRRIRATDPLWFGIDYRLLAPSNSVVQFTEGKLVACDPNGEKLQAKIYHLAPGR